MISELARSGPPLGGKGLFDSLGKVKPGEGKSDEAKDGLEKPSGAKSPKEEKVESFDSTLKRGMNSPPKSERKAEISQPRKVEGPPKKEDSEVKAEPGPKPEEEAAIEQKMDPKINKGAVAPEETKGVKSEKLRGANAKEKAMLKFMDSLESEFSISPTRIVEAMANLKAVDLTRTPEQTADQVIENLKLEPQESTRARGLYEGMLAELSALGATAGQPAMSPSALAGGAFAGGAIAGSAIEKNSSYMMTQDANGKGFVMSDGNMKRLSLNSSLEKMNEKFFMKGDVLGNSNMGIIENGKLAGLKNIANKDAGFDLDIQDGQANVQLYGDAAIDPSGDAVVTQQGLQAAAVDEGEDDILARSALLGSPLALQKLVAKAREQGMGGGDYQVAGDVRGDMPMQGASLDSGPVANPLSGDIESAPLEGAALRDEKETKILQALQMMPALYGLKKAVESLEVNASNKAGMAALAPAERTMIGNPLTAPGATAGSEESSDGDEMSQSGDGTYDGDQFFSQAVSQPDIKGHNQDVTKVSSAFAMSAMSNKSSEEADPNVRTIMNQAQYLIRKGGGEMNVQMSPEGLGKVHLKLSIEDGKVNVEMAAQNSETKKLLENSAHELKSQLTAHKLQVESIRVDVAEPPKDTANSQLDLNFNNQNARQEAQKFMQEFRQNSWGGSRGDSFHEKTGLKAYGPKPTPLGPAREGVGPRANPNGSSLNLVA